MKSGESKLAFCKRRGIDYHTFLKDCKLFSSEEVAGFARVELPEPSISKQQIEIHERDGRRVFLPLDTPESIIRLFLNAHARVK